METSSSPTQTRLPPRTDGSDELSEAEVFLTQLERFVLGRGTLGEVLGWTGDQIDGVVALGDQLLAAGRTEDALALFEGALALDPRRGPLHCRLTLCHLAEGEPERAAACLVVARRLLGDLPELDLFEHAMAQTCERIPPPPPLVTRHAQD